MAEGAETARKRHSDEDILRLLREIELLLAEGSDEQSGCRSVGVSDATYYNWCKRFGGMGGAGEDPVLQPQAPSLSTANEDAHGGIPIGGLT